MTESTYHNSVEAIEKGERLRRIRNLANLSRKSLCDEAEININTYIGYEVGKYGGLSKKGAKKIIDYLASKNVYCSLEWLMYGVGKGPFLTEFNIGQAKESTESFSKISDDDLKIKEELLLFQKHYPESVYYRIVDDGMFPFYSIGDYIAGVPYSGSAITKLIGFDCIIRIKNSELTVRNLRKGQTINTFTLTSSNPNTVINNPILYDLELSFAAKIIWHRKVHKPDINCDTRDPFHNE